MDLMQQGKFSGYFRQFKRIDEVIQRLDNDGHLELMQNLLQSIFETTIVSGLTSIKDPLKVIVNHLIDQTWKGNDKTNEAPLLVGGKFQAKGQMLQSGNKKNAKKGKIVNAQNAVQKQEHKSKYSSDAYHVSCVGKQQYKGELTQQSYETQAYSTFKGSSTFSKQKRDFGQSAPQTPGPGQYTTDSLRPRPNAMTTIPKGARKDFFTNESSPGPAHYSPKLSFVSKQQQHIQVIMNYPSHRNIFLDQDDQMFRGRRRFDKHKNQHTYGLFGGEFEDLPTTVPQRNGLISDNSYERGPSPLLRQSRNFSNNNAVYQAKSIGTTTPQLLRKDQAIQYEDIGQQNVRYSEINDKPTTPIKHSSITPNVAQKQRIQRQKNDQWNEYMALLTSPIYTHKNPKVNITSTITGINHMKTAGRAIINQPPNNIF